MIVYKKTASDNWFVKIEDGEKSPSFTNRGEIGKKMWSEMQGWIAGGGQVEDEFTSEELAANEIKNLIDQISNQKNECISLLRETDHKVLSDYEYQEDVEQWTAYRQQLRTILKSGDIQKIPPKPFS